MFTTTAFVLNLWVSGEAYAHAVCTQMNSFALTKHLPLCPYDLHVCMSLHSKLCLCLEAQKCG